MAQVNEGSNPLAGIPIEVSDAVQFWLQTASEDDSAAWALAMLQIFITVRTVPANALRTEFDSEFGRCVVHCRMCAARTIHVESVQLCSLTPGGGADESESAS